MAHTPTTIVVDPGKVMGVIKSSIVNTLNSMVAHISTMDDPPNSTEAFIDYLIGSSATFEQVFAENKDSLTNLMLEHHSDG